MDLIRHLRYFVVVAEELHFGNAAERLGMAQPPLSQRVQRLERELGVRLFDRSRRRVALTPHGEMLLGEAREILARVDRMFDTMAGAADAAVLRAAVPPDLGGVIIAALIAAYRERRPEVRLSLSEIPTSEQVAAIRDGALDAGIVRHPIDADGLELGPVFSQPVGVLLPEGSPLAATPAVHLADLGDRPLVLFPRETAPGLFDEVLTICRRYGFVPAEIHSARDPGFAAGLVLSGTAVSLTPQTELPGTVWRPLLSDPILWRTSTVRRGGPAAERVIAFQEAATEAMRTAMRAVTRPPGRTRRLAARPASGFLA